MASSSLPMSFPQRPLLIPMAPRKTGEILASSMRSGPPSSLPTKPQTTKAQRISSTSSHRHSNLTPNPGSILPPRPALHNPINMLHHQVTGLPMNPYNNPVAFNVPSAGHISNSIMPFPFPPQQQGYLNVPGASMGFFPPPSPLPFPMAGLALGMRLGITPNAFGMPPGQSFPGSDFAYEEEDGEVQEIIEWGFHDEDDVEHSNSSEHQIDTTRIGDKRPSITDLDDTSSAQSQYKKPRWIKKKHVANLVESPQDDVIMTDDVAPIHHREHSSSSESVVTVVAHDHHSDASTSPSLVPTPQPSHQSDLKVKIEEFKHLMEQYKAAQTPEDKKTLAALVRAKQGEVEVAAARAKRATSSPPPTFSNNIPPPQPRPIKRYLQHRYSSRYSGGPTGCLGIASPTMYIIEISDDEGDWDDEDDQDGGEW